MTLKQFAKLASGAVLALIVYSLNPPGLIKWFLILFFVGLGAAMAFLPFEGRPVDVWIIAFFKRIYSPTQYIWRQRKKLSGSPSQSSSLNIPPPAVPIQNELTPASVLSQTQPVAPVIPLSQPIPQTQPFFQQPALRPEGQRVTATFNPSMAIPATPSLPNLIVGYIHTKEDKIIEGAILEIRDSAGNPVRALKTNKLGQFQIATPLPNGDYEVETDKEGFSFDIIKINLTGEILSPVEIISK